MAVGSGILMLPREFGRGLPIALSILLLAAGCFAAGADSPRGGSPG